MSSPSPRLTGRVVAAVAAAGFAGTLLRYGLSLWANDGGASPVTEHGAMTWGGLPWGTVAANVLGCLVLGWATGWWTAASPAHGSHRVLRLAVAGGFLGSFTSFSAIAVVMPVSIITGAAPSAVLLTLVWTVGIALVCCLAAATGVVWGRRAERRARPAAARAEDQAKGGAS